MTYPRISQFLGSTIYAIAFVKSPKIAINNSFLSETMPLATIKNDKMISGLKYINLFCMQSCILKNVGNWPFYWDTLFTQKYNFLMNGSRYDQIRSTGVQKTYIIISEGISYCIDWKMAFVWLLYQPSTHKFPIYRSMIQVILSMIFRNMPINNKFLSKLILWAKECKINIWTKECKINIRGELHWFTSYEMRYSKKYGKLTIFAGTHSAPHKWQYLKNGTAYDQN